MKTLYLGRENDDDALDLVIAVVRNQNAGIDKQQVCISTYFCYHQIWLLQPINLTFTYECLTLLVGS